MAKVLKPHKKLYEEQTVKKSPKFSLYAEKHASLK